jgi:alkylresorcinol/alkylpyrone synthase
VPHAQRANDREGPGVLAVASALPPPVDQREVARLAVRLAPQVAPDRVEAIFTNTGIRHRHLAMPVEWYAHLHDLAERQRLAADLAVALGAEAARRALGAAGVGPSEVDAVVLVTSTVLRSPGVEASLVGALGLRPDVRRVPLGGLASLGGAAGLALAADLVRAHPGPVLLVAVELNSVAFVAGEAPLETAVSMALFSDGAAAVVVGPTDRGVRLLARHSTLVPASEPVMGFEVVDEGLRWRLAPEVPEVAARHARASVEAALATVGWSLGELDHVLIHPGGAKVLDAVAAVLDLPPDAMEWSWEAMRDHGNVSSVTVLLVLEHFLAASPAPGRGLLTAMGPGFAFEHVLVELGHGADGPDGPGRS